MGGQSAHHLFEDLKVPVPTKPVNQARPMREALEELELKWRKKLPFTAAEKKHRTEIAMKKKRSAGSRAETKRYEAQALRKLRS